MAAPTGNNFWELRSKHGRDKLFESPELMWEAACEYFQWCQDNPFMETQQAKGNAKPEQINNEWIYPPNLIELPRMRPFTMQGLCLYLNCNTAYFRTFKSQERGQNEDFSTVIKNIEETIYNQKFSGAAAGFLNANIIARDLGLSDKVDQRFVDKDDNDRTIEMIQLPKNGRDEPIDPLIEHK